MSDKLDLSLDDIIKISKKTGGGRGRGRGRGGTRGGVNQVRNRRGRGTRGGRGRYQGSYSRSKAPSDKWDHDMFSAGKQGFRSNSNASRASGGSGKLLISNLDFGVSDSDINELFSEFGALRRASVHYDRSGRSMGSADVHFERRSDASRALKQYNGVPLDGRVMNIRFVDGQESSTQNGVSNGRGFKNQRSTRASFGRGRGRGRGRGGGRQQKKEVSAEELDKQLDDYISKSDE